MHKNNVIFRRHHFTTLLLSTSYGSCILSTVMFNGSWILKVVCLYIVPSTLECSQILDLCFIRNAESKFWWTLSFFLVMWLNGKIFSINTLYEKIQAYLNINTWKYLILYSNYIIYIYATTWVFLVLYIITN